MVTFGPASVVVIPFPFSDLSGHKLRPAIVLTSTGNNDWLLCQVTSNAYIDPLAIHLSYSDMKEGTLDLTSYARPLKLFSANENLVVKRVAILQDNAFKKLLTQIIIELQKNMPN